MAGMGNARHLAAGDPKPEPAAKDVLRVYGMKFCPFVHRLKLVLAAKNVKHETVNINLSSKPAWYKESVNPRGTVPSLEINGTILYESDITAVFVDEAYPGRKLMTSDPIRKAQEFMALGDHKDVISGFYAVFFNQKDSAKKEEGLQKLRASLVKENAFLATRKPFICGDKPGFMDYMYWPHLERIVVMIPSVVKEYPAVKAYCEAMEKDKAVIACRQPNDLYNTFFKGVAEKNVDYDIGVVE